MRLNKFFLILFLSLISAYCYSKIIIKNDINQYTGQQIEKKFEKIQNFITEFEIENGGPVFEDIINIYKIDKSSCVIVSQIDGDSGMYGMERIIYFSNSKISKSYQLDYSYTFLNSEGTKKSSILNYKKPINNNRTRNEINTDFKKYFIRLNTDTLNQCSSGIKMAGSNNLPIKIFELSLTGEVDATQGGRLELLKARNYCILEVKLFGEMGQEKYAFRFNNKGLINTRNAAYTYPMSIYELKPDTKFRLDFDKTYKANENKELLSEFNLYKKRIPKSILEKDCQ
ncbi:hypothetical protein D7V21_10810 [Acinetobacter guerrae]|uniref:Uncharacterized protein n=1 Tax=Acinetobacter guerrae TaxID=1843371 RepID=A0A3A8EHJ4_9GAMM|nr:hypothetical protein [Acinetobacter guerrae]RKG32956.1 hypothetical protein D7V21_10810 [Acinetobacter guerrae]